MLLPTKHSKTNFANERAAYQQNIKLYQLSLYDHD